VSATPAARPPNAQAGPALLLAEHERQHQQQDRGQGEGEAGQVEAASRHAALGPEHPRQQHEDGDAQRHVDEEHRPPAGAEQVGLHEDAAEDEAGHGADRHDGGVDAQRLRPRRAGEVHLDHAHDLGHHHRRAGALEQPGTDQELRRRRQAAGERAEREDGRADREHAADAEHGAEPGAGDEEHAVDDGVPGDDELQGGTRGVEVAADRAQRDVHDADVEQRHGLADEQDREDGPGGRRPARRGVRGHRCRRRGPRPAGRAVASQGSRG
jgi:hypothetical protein